MNVQDNRMINSPHGKYSGNFYIPEGGRVCENSVLELESLMKFFSQFFDMD